MNEQPGFTIWFTGLPRSGKSTIARQVVDVLRQRGCHVEFLNSARIRKEVNRSLGFTREEIETSVQRLGYECLMLNRNGVVAVVTAVSPYRDARDAVRGRLSGLVEVYCRAPMDVLEARDTHGFFARAKRGEIEHVAGVNAPYEEPIKPEVTLDTEAGSVEACTGRVISALEGLRLLEPVERSGYTPEEEEIIRNRLRDLGYL